MPFANYCIDYNLKLMFNNDINVQECDATMLSEALMPVTQKSTHILTC